MLAATIRSSVTANMHLIGERYFWYRYRVQNSAFSLGIVEFLTTNRAFNGDFFHKMFYLTCV